MFSIESGQFYTTPPAFVAPVWDDRIWISPWNFVSKTIMWHYCVILDRSSISWDIRLNTSTPVFTARRYAKRGICHHRVSVTLRYCIKTAKCRITQITPQDSPMTQVFWHQSSRRNSNGITCRWGALKLVTFDEKRAITRKQYKIDA